MLTCRFWFSHRGRLLLFPWEHTADALNELILTKACKIKKIPPVLFWSSSVGTDRVWGCKLLTHRWTAAERGGAAAPARRNWTHEQASHVSFACRHSMTSSSGCLMICHVASPYLHTDTCPTSSRVRALMITDRDSNASCTTHTHKTQRKFTLCILNSTFIESSLLFNS